LRSLETVAASADKRPSDNPPNAQRVEEAARDCANLVKPIEAKHLLMGSNLKNAVYGRVANGLSRFQMLFAKGFDNGSP
jgi:hypothetical protein